MKTVRLFVACGFLAAASVAIHADAATTYVLPGTVCKHWSIDNNEDFTYWAGGQIENTGGPSGQGIAVGCPLIRHNATASLSNDVYVRVYNNDSGALNCRVTASQAASTNGDWEEVNGATQGYDSISISTDNLSLFTYGRYTVRCYLNPNDKIDSIRYAEP